MICQVQFYCLIHIYPLDLLNLQNAFPLCYGFVKNQSTVNIKWSFDEMQSNMNFEIIAKSQSFLTLCSS